MDQETGETFSIEFYRKNESGEYIHYNFNAETGEQETIILSPPKQKFKVPSYFISKKEEEQSVKETDCSESHYYSNEYTSSIVFLLPSLLFFYYPLSICFFIALETILHYKAHKYNDIINSKVFVFQSPLHAVTSQFCSYCRYQKCGEKFAAITKQIGQTKKWCSVLS